MWNKVKNKKPDLNQVVLICYNYMAWGDVACAYYENEKWYLFHTETKDTPIAAPDFWSKIPTLPNPK